MRKTFLMVALILYFTISLAYGGSTPNFGWCLPTINSLNYPACVESAFIDIDEAINDITGDVTPPATLPAPTTTGFSVTAEDGSQPGEIKVSWTASIATDVSEYQVRIRLTTDPDTNSSYTVYTVANDSLSLSIKGLIPGESYITSVRAIDTSGNPGAWSSDDTRIIPSDIVNPGIPAGLTVTGGFNFYVMKWTNTSSPDLNHVEIWASATNDIGTATKQAESFTDWFHYGNFESDETRYMWVRSVDKQGNVSAYEPSTTAGVVGLTIQLDGDVAITNATINLATKVQGLLPNVNLAQITDSTKLANTIIASQHISNGTINSSDMIVANTIVGSDILGNSVNASRITAGTISSVQIGTNEIITSTANIGNAVIKNADIDSSQITSAHIIDGTIDNADIGNLSADKIDTGTLTVSGTNALIDVQSSGEVRYSEGGTLRYYDSVDTSAFIELLKISTDTNFRLRHLNFSAARQPSFLIGTSTDRFKRLEVSTSNGMLFSNDATAGDVLIQNGLSSSITLKTDEVFIDGVLAVDLTTTAGRPTCPGTSPSILGGILFDTDANRFIGCKSSGWTFMSN